MSLCLALEIFWGNAKCRSVLPEWDRIIISVVNAKGKAFVEEPRGVLVVGMALEADGKDEDQEEKLASMFIFIISLICYCKIFSL